MILIILFLICLIISIFYLFSDSKQNRIKCYSSCCYDEDDPFEDKKMMDIMLQNCEEEVMEDIKSSVLVYPDPYEMNPEDMMYLGEDGELLEDL